MSSRTPNPVLNPIAGTTINTQPEELGLNSSISLETKHSAEKSPNIVQRAVSKLSNSAPHIGDSTSTGHRKLFSLHRKGKGKEAGGKDEEQTPRPTQPTSPTDDSPFARSLSPSPASSRPSLDRFRGSGSMRAGTQTLIQALQAIPWDDGGDDNEEALHHAIESYQAHLEGGSSDEEDSGKQFQLSSSIHAIHRPVARSRKGATPLASKGGMVTSSGAYFDGGLLSEEEEESDEDNHGDEGDFETRHESQPPTFQRPAKGGVENLRMSLSRSTSLATVRLQRRARLAEKLKDVFGINGINEVVAEMPCWLLRSVLLQGYMYLTNAHLCFFAHMPSREDQILKSGNLSKKTQRTKRWIKHWFVLKNDVLSWYESSADPYFPHGAVDLRYAISCEAIHDKGIRLRTNQKTVLLHADSVPSREEWVKAIKKVIFKAQNLGESVKIAIPYSAVLDVEKSAAMDFSETIEVKVVDKGENYAVDSYFFAYFNNLSHALEDIRGAVRAYHHSHPPSAPPDEVKDTTAHRSVVPGVSGAVHEQFHSVAPHEPKPPVSSGFKLSSFLRPFSYSSDNTAITAESKPNLGTNDEFTHIETVAAPSAASLPTKLDASADAKPPTAVSETQSLSAVDHTYPPASPLGSTHETTPSAAGSWSVPVPSWLNPRSYFATPQPSESTHESADAGEVKEVISSMTSSHFSGEQSGEQSFAVLDANDDPHSVADPLVIERFRTAFALDERETLLGSFSGYLFRVLPVYGKIYISTNYFCFRSSQVLTRTRMIIPIRDILAAERSKAFRFTHHGLVVVIKGHEEVFLEFGTSERRNACMDVLEHQLDECRRRLQSGEAAPPSKGKRDALILEELEPSSLVGEDEPVPPPEALTESLPAVMFTSTSSTFLTFKPQTSLHFTCLTIGSRGDVQPYIALCKGLKADGHRVRIATHAEFKDWIEGHGIEFGYVGGDPAELMRICVENGTFTVSFLREGVTKFRGWIDDLLRTAYDACKGTDVLIESPSAMAGIHIAEALQIPYYRAFTMPWTRTRAYPHAFAVPDRKMGGGYNYMSYVMFDQVFWRAISGQINRWRRDVLGIESTNLDKLEPHKVPFLYNFSPAIVPPPLDWYEWIRVTGYWFLDDPDNSNAKKWTPAPELVSFIDSAHAEGKKVVYIGFGSIVVSDPEAMTKCVVEAIKESGVHAILSKGWSDRLSSKNKPHSTEQSEPLPSYIYPIESVPHDWLFQRIDAACHHGGAGTTGASLRAGIPTIIKPFFGDQFFWADRVEALGIGSGVRKLTVEHLAEALRVATTDLKQIERAKMVGNSIRSENGVTTAVEAIYRDLEYARSLVKKPVPHPPPPAPVAGHPEASHDAGTSTDCTPQPKSPKSPKSQLVHWHKDSKDSTQERTWENSSNDRPPSEDWSVVDEEGKHSLESERPKLATSPKRSGFASTLSEALGYRSGGK